MSAKKLVAYKNDFKYKKHRNFDLSCFKDDTHLSGYLKEDMDTTSYRLQDCFEEQNQILDFSHLSIKVVPLIPKSLYSSLIQLSLSDNKLTELPNLAEILTLNVLDLSSNKLKSIPDLPNNIEELSCRNNRLHDISKIYNTKSLKRLDCSNNNITNNQQLNNGNLFPINLEILECPYNQIISIHNLPKVRELHCNNNNIELLGDFPYIKYLDCSTNKLNNLYNYTNLELLFCSHNNISGLPVCKNLVGLYCNKNNITIIPHFSKLKEVLCDYNKVEYISKKYDIAYTRIYNDTDLYIEIK